MNGAQNREDDQSDKNEMEMSNQVITVLGLPIEWRDRVTHARLSAEKEL